MALIVYQGPSSNDCIESNNEDLYESKDQSYVGLSNQGATCYLNGLLQTLYMTPEFRKAIFTWNYNPENDGVEEWCIPLQLQKLFGLLQLSKLKYVDTIGLTRSFGWEGSEVFQQQDVQELTRVLFDALEDSFKDTPVENIIDELYSGNLVDYIRCIDVDYESERVDKCLDVSLAIVPFGSNVAMKSISECIEMFLRPEILDGDNQYYAEVFQKKVDAIKGLKFLKLPQIMSIQLKRFVYDFSSDNITLKKINDIVKFPMILDMNKYVTNKSSMNHNSYSSSSSSSYIENNDDDAEQVDEFEAFLLKQIEILRSNRLNQQQDSNVINQELHNNAHTTTSTTTNSSNNSRQQMNEVTLTDTDFDDVYNDTWRASFNSIHQSSNNYDDNNNNINSNSSSNNECISTIKIEEEESYITYESLTDSEIVDLINTRGPWIYELYAVLIHSGAISGGHYFAYIKDLHSKRWYNFNDSSVTPIDEKIVRESWGTDFKPYYPLNNNNRNNNNNSSLSSSNAYMLMYRKITIIVDDSKSIVVSPIPIISDGDVPQYVHKIVREEFEQQQLKREIEIEMRNQLKLRVYCNDQDKTIAVTKSSTLHELMNALWVQFELWNYIGSDIVKKYLQDTNKYTTNEGTVYISNDFSSIPPHVCYDLFRLRMYNTYTKISSDVYEYETQASFTLESLFITDYKYYTIETKLPEEDWEPYYVDGTSVSIIEYDPTLLAFKEPKIIRLKKLATLLDLKTTIATWLKYSTIEEIQLMKLTNVGFHDVQIYEFTLEDNLKKLRDDLGVYDSYKLYLDRISPPPYSSYYCSTNKYNDQNIKSSEIITESHNSHIVISSDQNIAVISDDDVKSLHKNHILNIDNNQKVVDSMLSTDDNNTHHLSNKEHVHRMVDLYLQLRNKYKVLIKLISNATTNTTNTAAATDYILHVDARSTVQGLRKLIKKDILPHLSESEEIRIFKQSLHGIELKDGSSTLNQNGFYEGISLAVSIGSVAPLNHFNLIFVKYNPPISLPGITLLPILSNPLTNMDDDNSVHLYNNANSFSYRESDDDIPELINASDCYQENISNQSTHKVLNFDNINANNAFVHNHINDHLLYKSNIDHDDIDQNSDISSNVGIADNTESHFDDDDVDDIMYTNSEDFDVDLPSSSTSLEQQDHSLLSYNNMLNVPIAIATAVPISSSDSDTDQSPVCVIAELVNEQLATTTTSSSTTEEPNSLHNNDNNYDIDVESSIFGELKVSNVSGAIQFEKIEGLNGIFVEDNTAFDSVRQALVNKLISLDQLPEGTPYDCIRLRDKSSYQIGRILTGSKSFYDNQMYLYENKCLAFQILDESENLPDYEIGDIVVFIQKWNRNKWNLSDKLEVLLQGSMSVSDISKGFSMLLDIPISSMLAFVIPKESELPLYDLIETSPASNYGRSWFDPTNEKRMLRDVSHDMRLQDGDLLLIQDTSESLMELTKSDIKSIAFIKNKSNVTQYLEQWGTNCSVYSDHGNNDKNNNNHNYNLYFKDEITATTSNASNITNRFPSFNQNNSKSINNNNSKNISQGLYIKTQRERQKDALLKSTISNNQLINNGNNNNNGNNDNNNIRLNNDEKEFERSGGMALFDDIN